MFILTKFQDLIQIPPHEFYKQFRHEIEDKINEKYANKVVQKVGLCICMWDLVKASDGLIGHGTGNVNVNVEFHMIVFRPFKGEIIAAKVLGSNPEGIKCEDSVLGVGFGQRGLKLKSKVTTEFFEDIFVPKTMLFEGCEYNDEEQTWVWRTDETELWFDAGTNVHTRIEIERWEDLSPNGHVGQNGVKDETKRQVPYYLEASMAEPGLGGTEWW